jgi:phage shock protein PspC (stress-responsive transcriptional regulator)
MAYSSPPPAAPSGRPSGYDNFIAAVRRLKVWRTDDRWLGGVAAGLAHRWGVEPLLVRGLFVASCLLGGIGFLAYAVGWALLPEASDGRIHLDEVKRGRISGGFVGACLMALAGIAGPLSGGLPGIGWISVPLGLVGVLAVVIVVVVLVASAHDSAAATTARTEGTMPMAHATFPTPAPTPSGTTPSGTAGPQAYAAPAPATASGAGDGADAAGRPPGPADETAPNPAAAAWAPGAGAAAAAGTAGTGAWPGYYGPPQRAAGTAYPIPPAPPVPMGPPPPRPRRRGAGAAVAALVGALTLFIIAGLLIVQRTSTLLNGIFVPGLAFGLILLMCGLVLVGLGLAGRRAGGMTAFTICVLVFVLPVVMLLNVVVETPSGLTIGDRSWTPTDATLRTTYSVGIGSGRLDLTRLTATPDGHGVHFDLGVGKGTVVLPADQPVQVEATLTLGSVKTTVLSEEGWRIESSTSTQFDDDGDNAATWTFDGGGEGDATVFQTQEEGGGGVRVTLDSPEVVNGAEPLLVVYITGSLGQIEILDARSVS